ncbi:OmpA family protein [Marinomonas rhizomae]|uniref:OmpA family protein n=1 Tax=Marinomonas rhizomae TaxID=491948 RepID=A0A366JC48_9GAMM|nr:OmpA family protein [Marinomonas rhizomae]RBP83949.1 OmpA family protein [Marinomonas rhizomae]RNF73352.1 OmpA family protein [Marinomonas rhizomae]
MWRCQDMDNHLKKIIYLSVLTILVSACASKNHTTPASVIPIEEVAPPQKTETHLSVKDESTAEKLGFYEKESGSTAVNFAFTESTAISKDQLDSEVINKTVSFIDKNLEFIRYSFGKNNSIYVADFSNALMFDYRKSSVRNSDQSLLGNFSRLYGSAAFGKYLYIIGHTDSDGSASYNYGLSARRARSVASILIDNDVDGSKLSIVPAGEYLPKVSNSTNEGKQQNRRVEVISADSRALIQSYLRQLKCPPNERCQRKILNIFDVRKVGANTEMNIKNPYSLAIHSPELNNLIQLDESLRENPDFLNTKPLSLNDERNLIEMGELRQNLLIEIDIRPVLRLAIQKRAGFHIPKKYIIKD